MWGSQSVGKGLVVAKTWAGARAGAEAQGKPEA